MTALSICTKKAVIRNFAYASQRHHRLRNSTTTEQRVQEHSNIDISNIFLPSTLLLNTIWRIVTRQTPNIECYGAYASTNKLVASARFWQNYHDGDGRHRQCLFDKHQSGRCHRRRRYVAPRARHYKIWNLFNFIPRHCSIQNTSFISHYRSFACYMQNCAL